MKIRGILMCCLIIWLSPEGYAWSHNWTDLYDQRWATVNGAKKVELHVTATYSTKGPDWNARLLDALITWNFEQRFLTFSLEGGTPDFDPFNCTVGQLAHDVNGVHLISTTAFQGAPAAETGCPPYDNPDGKPFKATTQVLVNKDLESEFFVGSSGIPSDKRDLQSSLTHELGHSTGWEGSHYNDAPDNATLCPDNDPAKQTMCGGTPKGTVYRRSLESHDKHTFENAYPVPPPEEVVRKVPCSDIAYSTSGPGASALFIIPGCPI